MQGGLATGPSVPGIVRRRLQPGARAHAGIAAVDRGIEQFGQRRPDRLNLGPVRFGFRGFAGLFGSVRFLRHQANMGWVSQREKGKIPARMLTVAMSADVSKAMDAEPAAFRRSDPCPPWLARP
jgi:hypothetical protein